MRVLGSVAALPVSAGHRYMKRVSAIINLLVIVGLLFFLTAPAPLRAQTGGPYDLSHSVIATGGGSNSSGGTTAVSGTVGQPSAGTISSGGAYSLRGGFWAFDSLAPTAAPVNISGRVLIDNTKIGVGRVTISLQDLSTGLIRTTVTNPLGYFHFEEIEMGLYLIRASSSEFEFDPPQQTISLNDDITSLDFSATSIEKKDH